MTEWVYVQSEPGLWTVGFYDPDGDWNTDGDYNDPEDAARRVHYLNGGRLDDRRDKALATAADYVIAAAIDESLTVALDRLQGLDADDLAEIRRRAFDRGNDLTVSAQDWDEARFVLTDGRPAVASEGGR